MQDQKTLQAVKKAIEGVNAYLSDNVVPVIDDMASRTKEGTAVGLWARRAAMHLTIAQQALELLHQDATCLHGLVAPPERAEPVVSSLRKVAAVSKPVLPSTMDEDEIDDEIEDVPEEDEIAEPEAADNGEEVLKDLMRRQIAQQAVIDSTVKQITGVRSKMATAKGQMRSKLASDLEALSTQLVQAQEEKERLDGEARLMVE